MQTPADRGVQNALWERFAARAEAIGADVQRVGTAVEAADVVLRTAPSPVCTDTVRASFPEIASRCAGRAADSERGAPDVVAMAHFAIAETGTLLLAETPLDRGACFLAEHLWLVVSADEVVPNLDLALERVRQLVRSGNRYVTFMSGPSRTADIERTLTIGVHGPRALTLLIVEPAG